jgi:hypothetical protein
MDAKVKSLIATIVALVFIAAILGFIYFGVQV